MLGELTLDKDYDTFEGEIQWCGKDVSLSLEVNAESKPSWTRARSAAKKLLADLSLIHISRAPVLRCGLPGCEHGGWLCQLGTGRGIYDLPPLLSLIHI